MVRIATDADVLSITLVARLTLEDAYRDILNIDVQSRFIGDFYNASIIKNLIEDRKILVVENEEKLTVGFLSLIIHEDACEIVSLYILPNYQMSGYGTELLNTLFQSDEIKAIFTDVESRNMPTQKFYARHGFIHEASYPQDLYGQLTKLTRLRWERPQS